MRVVGLRARIALSDDRGVARKATKVLRLLDDICEVHEPRKSITIDSDIRDPKDMHVIAAAIHQNCDLVITGDKDLLELHTKNIQVIAIADFLELIRHD